MTTIHLSDAQRDTFAACGLIVIDGEPCPNERACAAGDTAVTCHCTNPGAPLIAPEGWRILTEPCDRCHGEGWVPMMTDIGPNPELGKCPDCVGGRRVVTLTATCPTGCNAGWRTVTDQDDDTGEVGSYEVTCFNCSVGVVTLGRFTIPALLPPGARLVTVTITFPEPADRLMSNDRPHWSRRARLTRIWRQATA